MFKLTTRLIITAISLAVVMTTWIILTSPWITWFAMASSPETSYGLLNTSRLNSELRETSLPATLPIATSDTWQRLRQLPHTLSYFTLTETMRTIVVRRAPSHPLIIAHIRQPNPETADASLLAIGTLTTNESRVGIGSTIAAASAQLRVKTIHDNASPTNDLTITVPSFALRTLPSVARSHWNTLIQDRLRLAGTNPDIIGYISQFDTTQISLAGDALAISLTGAIGALETTVEEWVQAAERLQRPQPQTFILPDGTRGVETIPGEAEEVFTRRSDNCRGPVNDRTAVWICQADQHVTISNSEQLAQSQPPITAGWKLTVTSAAIPQDWCAADQQPDLPTILLCQATSIAAQGGDNSASIIFIFE